MRAGNPKDVAAGLLFIAIGAMYGLGAYHDLAIGSARNMGPGYFPLLVSGSLVLVGTVVALRALGEAASPIGGVPWRAIFLISLSPLVFALTLRGLGFVPAVALTGAVAAFASRQATLRSTLGIVVVVTLICVAVFLFGLGLPVRPFGPWIGG